LNDPGGGLITLSKEWFGPHPDVTWNEGRHQWTFPSGATIQFRHCQHEDDKHLFQGGGHQFIGFDELTHFTESIYLYIGFSRGRRRMELKDIPVQTFASANPGGIGHIWVNKRFITQRSKEALFVPATIWDNPGLDAADYEITLGYLPDTLRKQLMDGDWGAVEGAAYDYVPSAHSVPPFYVPADWERFEFMDHGLSNPAAWYICATDYDGNLIVFDGYYAQTPPAKLISDHTDAVLALREYWYPSWEDPDGRIQRGQPRTIADPSVTASLGMLSSKQGIPATIATEYTDQSDGKVVLIPGNNDRQAGMARVKELLRLDPERVFPDWHPRRGESGAPRLFIVEKRCPELVEQVANAPVLPLDSGHKGAGEVVDPAWETAYGHAHAALRYGVMSRPDPSEELHFPPDDPRLAFLEKIEARWESGEHTRPHLIDV